MVEYVSPNNNKPLHLGHVRNGLLGASVSALLEKRGAEVVRTMILNDRGLSISKSMAAYAKWHEGETPEGAGKKSDAYVGDLYVEFEKGSKDDPSLVDEAHELIRKWEEGDKKTRALWKKLDGWVEEGHARSFERLGFRFDVVDRESDVYLEGKRIVEEGLERGAFERDGTGAVIARLEAHGLPDKVMLRADGTSVYITQDLALAKKRFERDGIDRLIYVVGNEQDLHFRQLFKILELLGREWASKLSHLSYGYVRLPEGRMKSREGTIVEADDLLDALEKDAAEAVKERHAGLDEDEVARRARIIAGGALKYHFLEVDPASDMVYDPKASLSFTGRTGPYLQYMHARIRSIIRKAESPGTSYESDSARAEVLSERSESKEPSHRSVSDEEHALAKLLARYPETVELAADGLKPSLVAHHLYELAKAFAAFYENVPVLEAPGPERAARLALVRAVERVLNEGLSLLGIDAPEEM
jgi:arginyl-tRNA synthetase